MSLEIKLGKERDEIRSTLANGVSDSNRDLLLHVLNIVSAKHDPKRCAYFGKLDSGENSRCLALTDPEVRTSNPCPFYNPSIDSKCAYEPNFLNTQ